MERISSPLSHIRDHYTVAVVGSGYGGSIAANRLARAGQSVCLLERGREVLPGEYPDTPVEAARAIGLETDRGLLGSPQGLFRFSLHEDIGVLSGNGLGGTSLINANVSLPPEPRVFEDPRWPAGVRADLDALLGEYMDRARDMLRPVPYPDDWPTLAKLEALGQSADHLGAAWARAPINVTFEDGPNHVGVEQQACTLCGDCVSGCNDAAKNTLLMNYLPDAKRHGAEIFCNAEVRHVEREADGRWTVHFRPVGFGREAFTDHDPFVRADVVVLAAGALGSTEILLRSRRAGLPLSDRLGASFTGNGDVIGISYNSDVPIHGMGYGTTDPAGRPPVGPCITGVIELRGRPELDEGLVVEEGVIPGALASLMPEVLAAAGRTIGRDTDRGLADLVSEAAREVDSLVRGPHRGAVDHTQTFLVNTHDDADGRMELDDDRLAIRWPGVGDQDAFHRADAVLHRATAGLGGTYVHNPVWSRLAGRDLVTVHPLGGCSMADDAADGVTDGRGRVYAGTAGTAVHDGLYVADGAVIPRSLGVNPLLTISALAERSVALLADERGWSIPYGFDDRPIPTAGALGPGIRFTERMRGRLSRGPEGAGPRTALTVTLTVATHDLEALLTDPSHRARVVGTVEAPGLHPEPLTVTEGSFGLLIAHGDHPDARQMVYRLLCTAEDGERYDLEGTKTIRDDPGLDLWSDTTTLAVTVTRDGEPVGRGVVRIGARDLLRQLRTVEVTGTGGTLERLTWQARFGRFFAGELFDTYGGIADRPSALEPDVPPRKRRELRTGTPSVRAVRAADGAVLRLTRHRGGGAGPVLLVHGMGESSRIFTLDTIETNLTEALVARGYDVWLLDWRASVRLPTAATRWDLDRAAADLPAVVADVLRRTGDRAVDVVAQGVGSLVVHLAVLRGMDGVRSIVASQAALDPVSTTVGRVKAGLHVPEILDAVGVDTLDASVDTGSGWQQRLLGLAARAQPVEDEERCDRLACRRATMLYGALFEHDRVNAATHRTLQEWRGVANVTALDHLAAMTRAGRLVDAGGGDTGLRDLAPLAVPITLLHGAENAVFVPEGTERSLARLRGANRGVPYARHVIPGYGHVDPIVGEHAARDVYPLILRHLDGGGTAC